ncbi:MAG: glutathione S-transferase [Alphaproteobacteria bacterium]|jgi:GST-like protein|nr:glutathione S-transferase [Alphaproteobacteria bacterium]PPR13812.1 MAG: Disulfide-bond oxidoreductase YfcG [Alphaproteobacteria bacterium MarineAlpha12_Bin1]|tara:strand:- start:3215 stop:3877 length:663 start_codon:yes stop_codon:yes gene_type:complete
MIDLYTSPTPNGWKVAMMLEELGLEYTVNLINLAAGEQSSADFLAMNPNGRIPVIVDHNENRLTVFDSNAILFYLAEKTGKLLPADGPVRHEVIQWLMFQASGIGPMQGQAVVFERYFDSDEPAARARYHNETRRLYTVLDSRLSNNEWLAGNFSIADISNWSWIRSHRWARVPTQGLFHLERWMEQMRDRPACERGLNIPPSPGRASAVKSLGSAMTTK